MGFNKQEVLLNDFFTQNLIIFFLFDIFVRLNLSIKLKKRKSGHLDYYTTTLLVITLIDYNKTNNTKYGNNSHRSLGPHTHLEFFTT